MDSCQLIHSSFLLPFAPLQEVVAHWIAESRIAIEKIRLLTLKAAHNIDTLGSAGARKEVGPVGPRLPSLLQFLSPTGHFRFHGTLMALRIVKTTSVILVSRL